MSASCADLPKKNVGDVCIILEIKYNLDSTVGSWKLEPGHRFSDFDRSGQVVGQNHPAALWHTELYVYTVSQKNSYLSYRI